jgi:hypothetical protein
VVPHLGVVDLNITDAPSGAKFTTKDPSSDPRGGDRRIDSPPPGTRAAAKFQQLRDATPAVTATHNIWRIGMYKERSGWVTFAGILLLITGSLNVIYGIAAIGDSRFFVQDAKYMISNLNTWGWITLGIGLIQVLAAGSLWNGGLFGRILGIGAASISAIAALLAIPAYPLWSLAIFAISIVIVHQISAHGTEGRGADARAASRNRDAMEAMADYKQ